MRDLPTDLDEMVELIGRQTSQATAAAPARATAANDQEIARVRDVAGSYGLDLSDPFVAAVVVRTLMAATQIGSERLDSTVGRLEVTAAAAAQPGEALILSWSVTAASAHVMMAAAETLRRKGVDGG